MAGYKEALEEVLLGIGKEALGVLGQGLGSPHPKVRETARRLGERIQKQSQPFKVPALKPFEATGDSAGVRARVALELWDLADPRSGSRFAEAARLALLKRGPQAVDALCFLYVHGGLGLRPACLRAIELIAGGKMSEDPLVWRAWAEGRMREESVKKRLDELAQEEDLQIGGRERPPGEDRSRDKALEGREGERDLREVLTPPGGRKPEEKEPPDRPAPANGKRDPKTIEEE
jgi:hypothetical protein